MSTWLSIYHALFSLFLSCPQVTRMKKKIKCLICVTARNYVHQNKRSRRYLRSVTFIYVIIVAAYKTMNLDQIFFFYHHYHSFGTANSCIHTYFHNNNEQKNNKGFNNDDSVCYLSSMIYPQMMKVIAMHAYVICI